MKIRLIRVVSLFLLLAGSATARAQTPQGTFSGIVTDATGAVVPEVTVVTVNLATSKRTSALTNQQGFYVLTQLPIGEYTIEAEKEGFKKFVRPNLTLTTAATLALDIQLDIGASNESVTITGDAPLLQTRSSDKSQLIESRAVRDLPLGDRRTLNILKMVGGAVFVSYTPGSSTSFSLAGGRTSNAMFWIDGGSAQNMRLGIGSVNTDPPVETVQEVKVISNSYAAEYGGSAGGVVIATTKSGGNEFHGSAFEYLRNDALDAANFFAPIVDGEKQKAPLRYNVFGGVIGGPIVFPKKLFGPLGYDGHNRSFFFFGYEGSRRKEGFPPRIFTVPTLLQRQGDFSQTFNARGQLITIYDPATTRVEGNRTVRDPFPGNRIPLDRIDPVTRALLNFYPLPNRAPDDASGANNFSGNYAQILPRNNYTVKLDHSFTERDKINVRYLYNSDNRDYTSVFPIPAADTLSRSLSHQHFLYLAYTRVFSSTVINEARFTYGWRIGHSLSLGLGQPWPSQLGLQGVPDEAFPTFTVAGLQTLGAASQERNQDPVKQLQWVDNLSITRGRHAFKLGAEARLSLNYEVNRPSIAGQYTFTTQPTSLPGASGTGVGLASLLLGFPNQATFLDTQPLDRSGWYLAGFFQDDWTVNQSLTLNLGVRWETDTPNLDANNRMNGFDPAAINPVSGTPGVARFAGLDGWPRAPFSTNWKNFGPRLGFAWRPFGSKQTVLRGGGGIFFAHPYDHGQPNAASLGFERSFTLFSPDNGITAPFYLKDGVPSIDPGPLDASFGAVRVGQRATTAVTFYERNRGPGYAVQFNLGLQRELPGGWLIEVSYLGNLSRKLASQNLSINQIAPAKLAEIAARTDPSQRVATQADRPFPQFSDVTIVLPTLGISNYHAGVLGVEKRFARGFSLNATYTWSKFLNNTDDGGSAIGDTGISAIYSNYYDRGADYGPSSNDIPHRFTLSAVYELPFGRNQRFLSHHWAGRLLGNWSISALGLLQSGAPLTVTTNTNTSNAFSAGPQRANVTGNPVLPNDQRTLNQWFDTGAFSQPAAFTFGNGGRGLVRGDGVINFDLSVLKNVTLSEQKQLQFRAELFNAFNHPNFLLPGTVLGRPGFGVVSTANPGRSVQLGLRLTF